MTKVCNVCRKRKPRNTKFFHYAQPGRFHNTCRVCYRRKKRERDRAHYGREPDHYLPAGPFREFLRLRLYLYESREDMARTYGIEPRIVYRLLVEKTEGGTVALSTVDRALTNDPWVSLSTLYPAEEDVA